MLPLLFLAGCLTDEPDDSADDTATRICEEVQADFTAESASIRACTEAAECGQVLTGTSCGCTRNLVARDDADTTAFYALIAEAGDECDLGLESTCDCPAAYGYDCVDSVCTWDYPDGSGPYPDCKTAAGATFTVEGLVLSGDSLLVTVGYGGGCETHSFTTCWPDGAFMESEPVQAALELFHDDGGDLCDAWLTEEVTVDLLPLKDAWTAAYGAETGTIVVHLGGESVNYSF